MKENPERMFGEINQERLTRKPPQSTLKSEGISMAEHQDSSRPESKPPVDPRIARWEKITGVPWNRTPLELRGAFLSTGELPGPGAMNNPNLFNPDNYTNIGLQSIVRRIQAQTGAGAAVDPNFIARRERELERLISTGQLTGTELGAAEEMVEILESLEEESAQALSSRESLSKDILTSREARDKYFNDLFATVDAIPHEFFDKAFNPLIQGAQYDRFIQTLIQASRGGPGIPAEQAPLIKEDLERYKTERRVREALHNMNAILYLPSVKANQLLENMQQFESLLGDYAHRTKGVTEMMSIYEDILREEMLRNNGYLPPESITGKTKTRTESSRDEAGNIRRDAEGNEIVDTYLVQVDTSGSVEERTKKRFLEFVGKYGLTGRSEDGQSVKINERLREWEVDRTFITARAMMIMTGRLLSIAAEGRLADGLGKYSSLFLQDILQSLSPFIHLVGKYGITEANLGVYLFEPDKETEKVLGFLRAWKPEEFKKVLDEYRGNEKAILESPSKFFYLMQQNPNRAGDLFTWQSWRYVDDPDTPSAIRDFIHKGRERMHSRWNTHRAILTNNPNAPLSSVYEEFMHRKEYATAFNPGNATKQKDPLTGKVEKNIGDIVRRKMETDWQTAHPGAPSIETYEKYANEYVNWVGTALRFERLRSGMEKGDKSRIDEGIAILKRAVDLQPGKLYRSSDWIRKRINARLNIPDDKYQTQDQRNKVERILKNFSALEMAVYRDREKLLDEGKTFEDASLERILQRVGEDRVITNAAEIAEIREFISAFQQDYTENSGQYKLEFITKREYTHGHLLWGGDIPLDEFNMSALAPTGSFVRRARDNLAAAEAWGEEVKLLNSIPDKIKTPDDLINALDPVYLKIQGYSADRAKEAYGQKLEGFLLFFGEPGATKVPVKGLWEKAQGKSFARIIYGNEAPMWSSGDMRYAIQRAYDKKRITKEKHDDLIRRLGVGWGEILTDASVTMFQLILALLLKYVASEVAKQSGK